MLERKAVSIPEKPPNQQTIMAHSSCYLPIWNTVSASESATDKHPHMSKPRAINLLRFKPSDSLAEIRKNLLQRHYFT